MQPYLAELLHQVDLRTLAEEARAVFNSAPESSSACPLHHGDNRTAFHLFLGDGGVWRWQCFTNCPTDANGGTAIDFLMRWKGIGIGDAIRELQTRVGRTAKPGLSRSGLPTLRMLKPAREPGVAWSRRAAEFCRYAQAQLWSGDTTANLVLRYLRESRLLADETIRQFGLGFNPADVFDAPVRWGLPADSGKVYCPRGVVIPHERQGEIGYVNVRRPLAGGDTLGKWIGPASHAPKFSGPRGGRRGLYAVDRIEGKPILILWEGEFDALLAWQLAGDLADHSTLGGARHRLDVTDAATLARAMCVPVILDDDRAGDEGRGYWRQVSQRVILTLPPAHDATDFARAHGTTALRRWIAGLVAEKSEQLLRALDMHQQPELFVRCVEIYRRALEAEVKN